MDDKARARWAASGTIASTRTPALVLSRARSAGEAAASGNAGGWLGDRGLRRWAPNIGRGDLLRASPPPLAAVRGDDTDLRMRRSGEAEAGTWLLPPLPNAVRCGDARAMPLPPSNGVPLADPAWPGPDNVDNSWS